MKTSVAKKIAVVLLATALLMPTGQVMDATAGLSVENTKEIRSQGEHTPYFKDVQAEYPEILGTQTLVLPGSETTCDGEPVHTDDNGDVIWSRDQKSIDFTFTVTDEGQYELSIEYLITGTGGNNAVRRLQLDGATPFYEADYLVIYREWADKGTVRTNSAGDDVRPTTDEIREWQTSALYDGYGFYSTPLVFYLTAGEHTLTLTYVQEDILLRSIIWSPPRSLASYKELSSTYLRETSGNQKLTFQAEDAQIRKNSASIRMESTADPAAIPFTIGQKRMNTVGGWRWRRGGDSITFSFEVRQSGYYQLAFRFLQAWSDGIPSYRSIAINGNVPCKELLAYQFPYSVNWQTEVLGDGEEPYLFWLEAGQTHTLTLTVVMGEMTEIIQQIYDDMLAISNILQDINALTGGDADANYDYKFFTYIPTLKGDMEQLAENLNSTADRVQTLSSKSTAMSNNLLSIASQIRAMIRNPFTIARRINQLTQAQTNLGAWYSDLQQHPLQLDEFMVVSSGGTVPVRSSRFFERVYTSVYNFVISFSKDYNSVAGTLDGNVPITETINVWVSRGTEWAEIVKDLADSYFTPKTGVKVNINIVPPSQLNAGSANVLMLSIISGKAPDVAMGVASTSPVEFAIRDAVVDLSSLRNFSDIQDRFNEKIFIPYQFQGGVFAVPETMNFTCLFYRTDIFGEQGWSLPNTWDDLYYTLLPDMYQSGMKFYVPQDYSIFLFQQEGVYYRDNGRRSALDSIEAYRAFQTYTDMFTSYGSPVHANFFSRFRTGEMPIGIGNYPLYIQLSTAAPELVGRWAIAALPGIKREDGSINRSFGGLAGECDIILKQSDKVDASWDFLQWWTTSEAQTLYARELEALIGVEARWNTANQEAFMSLGWNDEEMRTIRRQLEWAAETPVVLGGYYSNRYINNAFNSVVVSGGMTVHDALEVAVKEIDRELKAKQVEYGVTAQDE